MKKWLIRIVIVFVVLIAAVFIAGALLPEEHHASKTLITKQSPQALWDAINDRDRKRALRLMEHLLDDSDALPILGSLASLYRRLLTGKELNERGASAQEITKATGQFSKSFFARLRSTSRLDLVHGLHRIARSACLPQ